MKIIIFLILLLFSTAAWPATSSQWQPHPGSPNPTTDAILWQDAVNQTTNIRFLRLYNDGDYAVECVLQLYYKGNPTSYYSFILYPRQTSQWYIVGPVMITTWDYVCY